MSSGIKNPPALGWWIFSYDSITFGTIVKTFTLRLFPSNLILVRDKNCKVPGIIAYKVSSFARATLRPGKYLVPRWRIKISPAPTVWPCCRFTPNRCAWESRPFLVDPLALVCAICPERKKDHRAVQSRAPYDRYLHYFCYTPVYRIIEHSVNTAQTSI